MNNDYKWETIGRCKFYTDGTTCTDIEVMDDAKEISFIYPKIMINRERCQKVFSSVEIMLIGRNVISIAIPNKMFPNIKHVESKSNSFINGKYLIERAGGKLLNVFGQSEDAEIDFTLFNRIGSYAFEGCRATKVSDSEDTGFIRINNNAFFGSGFMNQPFVNGIKCVGSLVVDVDETADEVIMPKTGIQYFPDKFVKCMRLSGCAFERLVFPSQIKEIGVSAFYACHKLKEIVFNEGLEKIAIGAFKSCMMLREVNLPASIRELGKSAFVCIPNNRPYGDLHINMTTIPDNLVKALVYYGSLKTLRCIYVHIDNANGVYDFVLPDSITSIRNGYSKIALDFNMLANTEYIHNTKRLETAFHYAASSRYECIVAYKTYLKTKHKAAKEFLEKEQYRVAAAIIEELDEKDFVDFVKLRCINLEYDSCIMKRLQEKNWNIALAYMLEEGNGKTKDALVI